jgi:SAM-dependent methyltransferase
MWDQRYGEPGFAYGTLVNDFLAEQAHRIPLGGEVLSLGEGEGRNAVFLAERGLLLTGVDASSVGLNKAKQLAAERGVTLQTVVSDLAEFDFGVARWDGIISIWCHLPRELRQKVHRAVTQALKPDGVFILEAYTPAQLGLDTGGPKSPDLLMTLSEVLEELPGLERIVGEQKLRDVHEGKHHDGPSAVLQLVARKPR